MAAVTAPRNYPERELVRECTKLLQLDGWRAVGMEPVSRREWARGTGEIGQPDFLYIRYCLLTSACVAGAEVLWVEYKSPRGRVSKTQLLWHEFERKRGALTAIAKIDFPATVDGFTEWYFASGLARRIREKVA